MRTAAGKRLTTPALTVTGPGSLHWECVGGGGVRNEDQLGLCEHVLNLMRRYAPAAAIAFNSTPVCQAVQ